MAADRAKFFFSYARSDGEFALRLAKELRAAAVDVWVDQLDIVAGQRWDAAVEAALHACQGMIAILSPESVASTNVMDEISYALEEKKIIVPILYKDCQIPFRLKRLQRADFTGKFEDGLAGVLAALRRPQPPRLAVEGDSRSSEETPRTTQGVSGGPQVARTQAKVDANQITEPSTTEVQAEAVSVRGGIEIGWLHVSWPFGKLMVRRERIAVSSIIGRTYEFAPEQVVSIEPYGSLPLLSSGIRINHNRRDYPRKIVFWCHSSRAKLISQIDKSGFIARGCDVERPGGVPFRSVALFVIVFLAVLMVLLLSTFRLG